MTDTRELVDRLKQWDFCWPAPGLEHDVTAAASLIAMQAEENRRLREALEEIAEYDTGATAGVAYTAKRALSSTGEKG